MAYIVQLHNGIYSESSVEYLRRIKRGVIDTAKPLILVAHQFTGDAIVAFNETLRQLNVRYSINVNLCEFSWSNVFPTHHQNHSSLTLRDESNSTRSGARTM